VEKILYPEIPDHPDHALAKKLLPKGCGAVFSFDIKGGREAGRRFIESLRVFSHLANVGDAKSLVIHPATTTHYRMSDEDLKKAGIGPGTVRLSIGLEDPEDLIQDLDRALAVASKSKYCSWNSTAGTLSPIPRRTKSIRQSARSRSCTAPAWTTPGGACRAATSATTAST
jgi:hypothetical protein